MFAFRWPDADAARGNTVLEVAAVDAEEAVAGGVRVEVGACSAQRINTEPSTKWWTRIVIDIRRYRRLMA